MYVASNSVCCVSVASNSVCCVSCLFQSTGKANVLAFDTSVLVEEKEYRGLNCIRLQQVGNKKEHWVRFEVSSICTYTCMYQQVQDDDKCLPLLYTLQCMHVHVATCIYAL